MAQIVYEASVYSQEVSYRNFNGEDKIQKLYFALDPIQLLQVIAGYSPKKIKSGNPALNGKDAEMTDEEQITMVRGLASKSAGTPSTDGESWIPFEEFENSIAGKAFLTKLVSSDEMRRDFSEMVILNPFRAYIKYAEQDPSNTPKEIAEFHDMLKKMENIFRLPDPKNESAEERKARLQLELSQLDSASE